MPISIDDIQPSNEAPADFTPPELNPDATIPDEVLQIPEFRALLEGSPPAVFVPNEESQTPEVQIFSKHINELLSAGFGIYRLKDDSGGVFFNTRFVSPQEVKAADDAGKIGVLATPLSELRSAFTDEIQGQPEATTAVADTVQSAVAPAPSGVQNRIATARTKNLATGSPTSGPAPGQGRILNSILKPTV